MIKICVFSTHVYCVCLYFLFILLRSRSSKGRMGFESPCHVPNPLGGGSTSPSMWVCLHVLLIYPWHSYHSSTKGLGSMFGHLAPSSPYSSIKHLKLKWSLAWEQQCVCLTNVIWRSTSKPKSHVMFLKTKQNVNWHVHLILKCRLNFWLHQKINNITNINKCLVCKQKTINWV